MNARAVGGAPAVGPVPARVPFALEAETLERVRQATVVVESGRGQGAGVVWGPERGAALGGPVHGAERRALGGGRLVPGDGARGPLRVVTNAHVARGRTARVRDRDGRVRAARIAWRDVLRDLAVLEVDAPDGLAGWGARGGGPETAGVDGTADGAALEVAPTPRPGALVWAFGHPLGWEGALAGGVLHGLDRVGPSGPVRWVRADVRLLPGNSGGPLVDASGRLLGINAMVARGTGWAVPTAAVRHALRPPGERPVLGAALRQVWRAPGPGSGRWRVEGPRGAEGRRGGRLRGGGRTPGLVLQHVVPGGPVARAGLRAGDLLLSWDDAPLATFVDLVAFIETRRVGSAASLDVLRGEEHLRREVILGSEAGRDAPRPEPAV